MSKSGTLTVLVRAVARRIAPSGRADRPTTACRLIPGLVVLIATASVACAENPPQMQWSMSFGQDTAVYSIRQTSDRGFIAAGSIRRAVLWDLDLYLLKMDSAGTTQWQKTYGTIPGRGTDQLRCVEQTMDGGYVMCGEGESTKAIGIKTDAAGNEQWRFSAFPMADLFTVKQTRDRGYVAAGKCEERVSPYLLKLDSAGNLQWRQGGYGIGFGLMSNTTIPVGLTTDGGFVVAAEGLVKTDSVGNPLWRREYPDVRMLFSVEQARDGGLICAGIAQASTPSGDVRPTNMVLLKTDSAGNPQWQKVFTQGRLSAGYCAWQVADGNYVIGGYVTPDDTARATLVKVNAQGGIVWTLTTPEYRCVETGQQTADGGFILCEGWPHIWKLGPATK